MCMLWRVCVFMCMMCLCVYVYVVPACLCVWWVVYICIYACVVYTCVRCGCIFMHMVWMCMLVYDEAVCLCVWCICMCTAWRVSRVLTSGWVPGPLLPPCHPLPQAWVGGHCFPPDTIITLTDLLTPAFMQTNYPYGQHTRHATPSPNPRPSFVH